MADRGSVSRWLTDLKAGDQEAAQRIWERYYRMLVTLARKKLSASAKREADEEDVTQNAFHSFFRGVSGGRFPRLDDRDDLWRLLVVITARKALDQLKHEKSKRQGGGTAERPLSLSSIEAERPETGILEVVGDEPSPEFAAQVAEEYQRLLGMLGDERLRQIAIWKMEGHTNPEIAQMLKTSLRSVARKLETIRLTWTNEASHE
jgi:RNA polymerase sigma factor (sigma-70 family)